MRNDLYQNIFGYELLEQKQGGMAFFNEKKTRGENFMS
jgi:hypothetical protein